MSVPVRIRRTAGFTLVELMVVIAIIGITAVAAARMYARGSHGETVTRFARTLMAGIEETRHMALTLGRPTKMELDASTSTMKVVASAYNPLTKTWDVQSTLWMPRATQMCVPSSSVKFGPVSPTCPLTTSASHVLCFSPNGRVNLPSSNVCPTTISSSGSGATLYYETKTGDKQFRLVIWGLTGMVKVIDTW